MFSCNTIITVGGTPCRIRCRDVPGALDCFLDTVVVELCSERLRGGAEMVHFDSADAMGDMSDSVTPGTNGTTLYFYTPDRNLASSWQRHGLEPTQNTY